MIEIAIKCSMLTVVRQYISDNEKTPVTKCDTVLMYGHVSIYSAKVGILWIHILLFTVHVFNLIIISILNMTAQKDCFLLGLLSPWSSVVIFLYASVMTSGICSFLLFCFVMFVFGGGGGVISCLCPGPCLPEGG